MIRSSRCSYPILVFAVSALFVVNGPLCASAIIPTAERQALIDLYDATGGDSWFDNTNWNGSAGTECTWFGVTCNATFDSVTEIDLSSNNLVGTLPASLQDLTNLQNLSLKFNQLTGSIPPELGNLANLQYLYLRNNGLTGSIPTEFVGLSSLLDFGVSFNQLSGSIPVGLGTVSTLQKLFLSNNHFTGSVPSQLGNLANLMVLRLNSNCLSGEIPSNLGGLTNLQSLRLGSNQLSGAIPTELGGLATATDVAVSYDAVWTDDPTLAAFLASFDPTWDQTQTVAPTGLAASLPTSSSVVLTWTPIPYTADAGSYAIFVDPKPQSEEIFSDDFEGGDTEWWGLGNPWVTTTDKTDTSIMVTGLESATTYHFVLRTVTDPHTNNQNQLISAATGEVTETTAAR